MLDEPLAIAGDPDREAKEHSSEDQPSTPEETGSEGARGRPPTRNGADRCASGSPATLPVPVHQNGESRGATSHIREEVSHEEAHCRGKPEARHSRMAPGCRPRAAGKQGPKRRPAKTFQSRLLAS